MFRRGISSSSSSLRSGISFSCQLLPSSQIQSFRFQSSESKPTAAGKKVSASTGPSSVNNVTLVGVVHDIQNGYVYEDRVTQFVVTTTSIDTTNPAQECVVEKDHHTVRCYGDAFAEEVRGRIKEGCVVCVSGRLRLNPQLEPTCGRHFYFPFLHVTPPHGGVALVHGDRRRPPAAQDKPIPTASSSSAATAASSAAAEEAAARLKGEELAAAAADTQLDEQQSSTTVAAGDDAENAELAPPLSNEPEPKSSVAGDKPEEEE